MPVYADVEASLLRCEGKPLKPHKLCGGRVAGGGDAMRRADPGQSHRCSAHIARTPPPPQNPLRVWGPDQKPRREVPVR